MERLRKREGWLLPPSSDSQPRTEQSSLRSLSSLRGFSTHSPCSRTVCAWWLHQQSCQRRSSRACGDCCSLLHVPFNSGYDYILLTALSTFSWLVLAALCSRLPCGRHLLEGCRRGRAGEDRNISGLPKMSACGQVLIIIQAQWLKSCRA